MDQTACNYNYAATEDDGSCEFPEYYDCDGVCINDTDGDGVCDEFEVLGCTDTVACNYDETATEENNSCTYAEDTAENAQYDSIVFDCDGACVNDTDGDGVCDEFETSGCTDATACNFNSSATDDDGTCTYPEDNFDCEGNCTGAVDACGVCEGDNSTCSPQPLFFSEYAEGSSNNKYLEIYNPTNETVDLAAYGYPSAANSVDVPGQYEYWNDFEEGATIPAGGVYVIANPSGV